MAKKRKTAIVVPDVTFGTLVHDEVATITGEQGITMLQVKYEGEDGKSHYVAYPVPAGVAITADMYDQVVDITIRDITNEVILELGDDDYYEDGISGEDDLMVVESTNDLEEIYNEKKIQLFTRMAGTLSTFVGGCALTGISIWLLGKPFPFPILLYGGAIAGVTLGVLFGLVPSFKGFRRLSSKYVSDRKGNWVNMETGRTNLNGGMVLPTRRAS